MNIYICDDNPIHLAEIRRQVEEIADPQADQVYAAQTAGDLLELLERHGGRGAVVLLDIELEEEGAGIALGREMNRRFPHTPIIFVTSYLHYASDTGEAEAIYFLEKPLDHGKLQKALRKARRALERDAIAIRSQGGTAIVHLDEITYIERVKRASFLHTAGGALETAEPLDSLLERLQSGRFVRTHKSFVVNLEHVRGVRERDFLLAGETAVPVSRTYRRAAREALCDFLGGALV